MLVYELCTTKFRRLLRTLKDQINKNKSYFESFTYLSETRHSPGVISDDSWTRSDLKSQKVNHCVNTTQNLQQTNFFFFFWWLQSNFTNRMARRYIRTQKCRICSQPPLPILVQIQRRWLLGVFVLGWYTKHYTRNQYEITTQNMRKKEFRLNFRGSKIIPLQNN